MDEVGVTQPARGRDLAAIAFALVLPSIITWIYFFQADSFSTGAQLAIFNGVKILQFVFPVLWVVLVQREPLRLRPPHTQGVDVGLTFGAMIGAAMFAIHILWLRGSDVIVRATEQIIGKVNDWGIDSFWKYAALGLFYSLIHSLLEEYYWRWFVYRQLRRFASVPTAIVISSLGFMAHHVLVLGHFFGFNSFACWFFSLCVAVGGAFWAWLYERTGSLLGPWLSHLLIDAAIFLIGFDLVKGLLLA